MPVTRDVIVDLLPLYLANEVSEDTRRLVVEYLARDPELASQVREQQARESVGMDPPVPPDLELRALARLRRRLAIRHWAFGLACFLTAAGRAVQVSIGADGGREFLLMASRFPAVFVPVLVCAGAAWGVYFSLRRR